MNTTVLLDSVHAEARELRPLKVLLTLVALPFFLAGVVLGAVVKVAWVAFAWAWAAAVVGYRSARGDDGTT